MVLILSITFIKYIPQVYLNYKRKSTVGWSLENVMLDFMGGMFSFLQIIINTSFQGKPLFNDTSDGFNIVKFMLSIITMIYDIIFMVQHYVLYRDKWQKDKIGSHINMSEQD
jgi:cystinosin